VGQGEKVHLSWGGEKEETQYWAWMGERRKTQSVFGSLRGVSTSLEVVEEEMTQV